MRVAGKMHNKWVCLWPPCWPIQTLLLAYPALALPAAPATQVWDAACAADSQLLAPATASKLPAEDAGAAAEAAAVLLTQASPLICIRRFLKACISRESALLCTAL